MILTGDYHTHTTYSHGKGSVLDNAIKAKEIGLKEIGITDHGFAHPAFGLREYKINNLVKDCKEASLKTGVNVLVGIESNVLGTDGSVDLKPKNYDKFDLFLAGIHKFVLYKFGTVFSLFIPNLVNSTFNRKNVSKSLIKENTKTFINVIKNNPVDIITHVNYCCYSDPVEVAKACADYGTYMEISSKKVHLSDSEWQKVLDTKVKFVIDSDAHSIEKIGEISLAKEMTERLNFPLNRIDNIQGRTPDFRFRRFKEGK